MLACGITQQGYTLCTQVRSYFRVRLKAGNGRIIPSSAVANGEPNHHPESVYYFRYLCNGKRVWELVGVDAPLRLRFSVER